MLSKIFWGCLSVGLFAGIWELCWALGWADPKLLPPPHIFLSNFAEQGRFFNTATRWQIGNSMNEGPSALESVMITVAATTMRVFVGLVLASVLAITVGVLIRYYQIFDKLVLPTVTLLSPVSPTPGCRWRSSCSASATRLPSSWWWWRCSSTWCSPRSTRSTASAPT